MSDKKSRNRGNTTLNENGETKTDAAEDSEISVDFFISTASGIGHNEGIASVPQAIDEYANHPNVMIMWMKISIFIPWTLTLSWLFWKN